MTAFTENKKTLLNEEKSRKAKLKLEEREMVQKKKESSWFMYEGLGIICRKLSLVPEKTGDICLLAGKNPKEEESSFQAGRSTY